MKEKIRSILLSEKDGLDINEIQERLDSGVQITALRQVLKELEAEKILASFIGESSNKGRPQNIYKIFPDEKIFQTKEREDLAVEERRLLVQLLKETTDRYSTMPIEKLKNLYAEAALGLLKEEPVQLLKRFAIWIKERHEEQIQLHREARDKQENATATKHRDLAERLEKLALLVFNRLFGVPSRLRANSGWEEGPYFIKYDFDKQEQISKVDPAELEKYLRTSIFGNSVIEEASTEQLKLPFHIGGSDASIQAVDLARVVPWRLESREIQIVTAVGTRYDILNSVRSEVDWYPEPKVLAEYERTKAINEGFLIPPVQTLDYEAEMEHRIREAAMNLRQYHKDHEIMFEKEPLAKLNFRDGRIFPVEHRFSDSIQPGLHGEIVRSALNIFKNIVNQIGVSDGGILYCGFVKRPGLEWLAPLVKWYLGFGSGDGVKTSIDPEMTLEDFLKFPNTDAFVSAYVFGSLREKMKSNKIFITFRTMRRFQSMEEPRISSKRPSVDVPSWKTLLKEMAGDVTPVSDESGLDTYATLCARGAVVSFYTSLAPDYDPAYEVSSSIPRIEILVPFTDLQDFPNSEKFRKNEMRYVKRTLDVLFHNGILDRYPDELKYDRSNPKIFLVPKTVRDAHIASKSIAKVYRDDFLELLLREAKIFWVQHRSDRKR